MTTSKNIAKSAPGSTRAGGSWSHPTQPHARACAARGVPDAWLTDHDHPSAASAARPAGGGATAARAPPIDPPTHPLSCPCPPATLALPLAALPLPSRREVAAARPEAAVAAASPVHARGGLWEVVWVRGWVGGRM